MSVKNNRHPLYTAMLASWELANDSYLGEQAIKAKASLYLPPTSGQRADGYGIQKSPGQLSYEAYLTRAYYPDLYKEAVEAAVGLIHKESPTIELPTALEGLRDNATLLGESLEMLLRKIHAKQLSSGRLGLLADIRVDEGVARPVIVVYDETSILDWDDTSIESEDVDVNYVLLDETGYERQPDFSWKVVERYRLLALKAEGGDEIGLGNPYGTALLAADAEIGLAEVTNPQIQGRKADSVPFVFINSADLSATPAQPPLEGLARLCLTIYRGEADYRQNLFMQGQDTLVRIGVIGQEDDTVRTGAGACIDVPQGGDAKYIGVNSSGLPEQRQALEADYTRAYQKSGQLMDATSRAKESGDALKIRVAAQTATLPQIAKTGAAGLELVLKKLAIWYGANPDEVVVKPNLQFTEADINGQTIVSLMQAKALGAPLSTESIHEYMRTQGLTKKTFDDEQEAINSEQPFQ